MKRSLIALGGGLIAAGLSFSAFAHDGEHKKGEEGKNTTVIGELIDTACFVSSDGDAKGADHAKCASKCMATGIPAGILPKDSKDEHGMLFLLTNPKPLASYAAKTIKVEGTVNEHLHAVDVKKLYVQQDGGKWQEVKLDDEHHKMSGDAGAAGSDEGHAEHRHAGSGGVPSKTAGGAK
jgi:hypothetical protein